MTDDVIREIDSGRVPLWWFSSMITSGQGHCPVAQCDGREAKVLNTA